MICNLHTHTTLCGHAQDEPEAYIQRAIEGGIRVMGFSDHIPFCFPDSFESGHRVKMAEAEHYMKMLADLREKYADKIEIHIGFEAEYYPPHFEKMLENARGWGAEYFILGQHFIGNEHPDGKYCGARNGGNAEELKEYADCVIAGMKTGKFTFLAHPDVFRFVGDAADYEREAKRICAASNETGVPLELNFLGLRDSRHYPNEEFWKAAGEYSCRVLFGCDAHRAVDAFDPESEKAALALAQKYALPVVELPEIRTLG